MLISLCSRKTLTRLLSTWSPAAKPTVVGVLDSVEELFTGTQRIISQDCLGTSS